ncbi:MULTISPECIES: hypothetical protein [Pseudoalteromonas]|uniref:Uncharacterized protein n=1 Tax=Pseudoalteromonas rubra TaxID=43658 RepID=A0A5S3WVS9_9GAMM|nr:MULTISPECIES: hypothetical protein [Pseudoalteromonas]MCO7189288.1 hypothetical protein [Pseudoalteromonas sp. XMcav2-N]TMP34370.1 hypothetical protein CWB98_18210 [Pseudoalteromonas rubra]
MKLKSLFLTAALLSVSGAASAGFVSKADYYKYNYYNHVVMFGGIGSEVGLCKDQNGLFGTFYRNAEICHVGWHSKSYVAPDYHVLVEDGKKYFRTLDLIRGVQLFSAGHSACSPNSPKLDGSRVIMGYYVKDHGKCYYPMGSRQYSAPVGGFTHVVYSYR